MLQHVTLAAAAAIDLLAITGLASFWAGYMAGPPARPRGALAAANPARRPFEGDGLDYEEGDGPWHD
jgi:hypothetical protein